MNKTIIINMNGIIFHIEEDAYEILKAYMTDVKRHFANEEDSVEITTDIENRIAEMFTEILERDAKAVIVTADVSTVISQMGTIEDFETEAEQQSTYTEKQFTDSRKLFRDPDDHLLGGVCAGIANYFDIDNVWVRLAFATTSFLGGSGVIAYIILWIIVPKASSRSDRMAMKGEKLDLKGFVKNFEEEVKNVHQTLNTASHHARPFVYKVRDFIGDFLEHFKYFLGSAGRIILKIFGIAILMGCIGFIIFLTVILFIFTAQGRDVVHVFPFSVINHGYSDIIAFSAYAVVIIPIVAIILSTLKVVFNSNVLGRSTGYTMLILWIVAVTLLGYHSSKVFIDFKEEGAISQTISIKEPAKNTYYLKLNDVKYLSKEDSIQLDITDKFKGRVITNDDDDENDNRHESRPQSVSIDIVRSDVPQPVLVESFSARGYSKKQALANAMSATYYFAQKDSVLTFDRTLKLPTNALWRNQEVRLTLKIPKNAVLVIDRKLERYVNDLSLRDCARDNNNENALTASFIMTETGLQCKIDSAIQAERNRSLVVDTTVTQN